MKRMLRNLLLVGLLLPGVQGCKAYETATGIDATTLQGKWATAVVGFHTAETALIQFLNTEQGRKIPANVAVTLQAARQVGMDAIENTEPLVTLNSTDPITNKLIQAGIETLIEATTTIMEATKR